MYNGIGLQTPRGSGTNGYVQRNLSAIRKTKEKVADYTEKGDTAVRPFDPELVEHDRRRQAEVRCMELRDLLEEENLSESEIEEKVNAFRAKLLAEKKLSYLRDPSGRPVVKDSHEFSVAQQQKNSKAKDAFGITDDFIPGSSMNGRDMAKEGKDTSELETLSQVVVPTEDKAKGEKSPEKSKKRKKSHKHSRKSSSSNSGSSDDEPHRSKKRKKEKKKKSKKSKRKSSEERSRKHRRSSPQEQRMEESESESTKLKLMNNNNTISASNCCIPVVSSESQSELSDNSPHSNNPSDTEDTESGPKYSLSIVDFSGNHKYFSSLPKSIESNGKLASVDVIHKTCLPLFDQHSFFKERHSSNHEGSFSPKSNDSHSSEESKYSCEETPGLSSFRKSESKSPPAAFGERKRYSHSSSSSRSSRYHSRSSSNSSRKSYSRSPTISSRSRSRSRSHSLSSKSRSSRSRSRSPSSGRSTTRSRSHSSVRSASRSPKSDRSRSPSIPRRRGSPSFMERRRITSARKRPIPYKRKDGEEWKVSSTSDSDD